MKLDPKKAASILNSLTGNSRSADKILEEKTIFEQLIKQAKKNHQGTPNEAVVLKVEKIIKIHFGMLPPEPEIQEKKKVTRTVDESSQTVTTMVYKDVESPFDLISIDTSKKWNTIADMSSKEQIKKAKKAIKEKRKVGRFFIVLFVIIALCILLSFLWQ